MGYLIEKIKQRLKNKAMDSLTEKIKRRLRKKAVFFQTGGIRPTYEKGESWIGKVCWQNPGEKQPLSKNGIPMIPLATIFVPETDYTPKALDGIKMINIFLDADWENYLDRSNLKDIFVIRTYKSLDGLIPCNYLKKEQIKPFPLVPYYVDNEFANWSDLSLEEYDILKSVGIDMDNYYELIFEENDYGIIHKLGGYPCSIQGDVIFEKGYEFVLQIYSDVKAGFNIIDDGNFYFGYNPETKDWSIRCDYY